MIARYLIAAAIGLVVALWLAAYLFLLSFNMNPYHATPFTVYHYWSIFSDRHDVMQHLVGSVAIAFAGLIAAGCAVFWPKQRPSGSGWRRTFVLRK